MNSLQQSRSLWIGDIEPWMDENYITQILAPISPLVSVKLIKDKNTGQNMGYGFLEFQTHQAAQSILVNYNGNIMPNASKPFKMNWGQHQKMPPTMVPTSPIMPMQKECSIYVCDLDVSTSEAEVVQFFQLRYRSAFAAKLIQDPNTGMNKGYGFVKFANQDEANRAIKEMNGQIFKGRIIKVSSSYQKNAPQQQMQSQMMGYQQQVKYQAQKMQYQPQMQGRMPPQMQQPYQMNQIYNTQAMQPQKIDQFGQFQQFQQPQVQGHQGIQSILLKSTQMEQNPFQMQSQQLYKYVNTSTSHFNTFINRNPELFNPQMMIPQLQTTQIPTQYNLQQQMQLKQHQSPLSQPLIYQSQPPFPPHNITINEGQIAYLQGQQQNQNLQQTQKQQVYVLGIQSKEEQYGDWTFNLNTDLQKQIFAVEKISLQQNLCYVQNAESFKDFKQELQNALS